MVGSCTTAWKNSNNAANIKQNMFIEAYNNLGNTANVTFGLHLSFLLITT